MSNEQMRGAVISVYPGQKWKHKVAAMSDAQVVAIYHEFLRKGKIK